MLAESGSVLTLLFPKFTVVVPEPEIVKIPGAIKTGLTSSISG